VGWEIQKEKPTGRKFIQQERKDAEPKGHLQEVNGSEGGQRDADGGSSRSWKKTLQKARTYNA